jgi:hypothetical protein
MQRPPDRSRHPPEGSLAGARHEFAEQFAKCVDDYTIAEQPAMQSLLETYGARQDQLGRVAKAIAPVHDPGHRAERQRDERDTRSGLGARRGRVSGRAHRD